MILVTQAENTNKVCGCTTHAALSFGDLVFSYVDKIMIGSNSTVLLFGNIIGDT